MTNLTDMVIKLTIHIKRNSAILFRGRRGWKF